MIAAYVRISSDTQDVARQRQSITDWCKRNGFVVDEWFEDSEGRNPRDLAESRVNFQRLMKAVVAGNVSDIVIDSQDRFGTRDANQLGHFLTILKDHNCELWSVGQGQLTKSDDATVLTNVIGALTSTREQQEKAKRNVGGKVEKAKGGEYQGGYPPYGLDVVCLNGVEKWRVRIVGHFQRIKIFPDGRTEEFNGKDNFPAKDANDTLRYRPGESGRLAVVKDIFSWYVNEDLSPRQIADRLNEQFIPNQVGNHWYGQLISQVLSNPIYLGLPTWNKRGGGRFKEWVDGQIRDVTGKAGRRRSEDDYIQPEKPEFEPIIDLETWNAVQAKVEASKKGPRRRAQKGDVWLKPFLVCGKCNKPMHGCGPQPRMEYSSYICGNYGTFKKNNPTGCRCHRVRHEILEALVDTYLEEYAPQVLDLAECQDSETYELALSEWTHATHQQYKQWAKMAETVTDWGDGDWWNIEKHYQPKDCDEIEAEIESKEAELRQILDGFFKLTPALQQVANERAEALKADIDAMRSEIEDLTTPWEEASRDAHRRSEALQYAVSLKEDSGPRKAEALKAVIDRIVCHYRYTEHKSFIDAVEIYPTAGEKVRLSAADACFGPGVQPGPG